MKKLEAVSVIYRGVETLVIPCANKAIISEIHKLLDDNLDNSLDCFCLEVKTLGIVEDSEDVEMLKDDLIEDIKKIQKDIDKEFVNLN